MQNLLDGWIKFPVGDAAIYSLLGLLVVFLGILLLVIIFTLFGFAMKRLGVKKKQVQAKTPIVAEPEQTELGDGEIPPEVVAAITAAVAAVYESENVRCDFVVRRIKKL